jgi:hypothetical protein
MFKLGATKTKQGAEAFIFEITKDKIYGRYLSGDAWMPYAWYPCGSYTGPGFPGLRDLVPNDAPKQPKKLLAYLGKSSGVVRYAVEDSMEAMFYDQDSVNMVRAERFDIKEGEV